MGKRIYFDWKFDESSDYADDHYRLITTRQSLEALIEDLQRIYDLNSFGEFEQQIGTGNLVPFQKIEIVESPSSPDKEEPRSFDFTGIFWFLAIAVPLLSLYGLFRLVMDVFF